MTKSAIQFQFTFQATLLATISVEAATQAEAERKLRTVLETSDANLGFLDNAPIVVPVAIEGDLDLVDAQEAPGLSTAAEGDGPPRMNDVNAVEQTDEQPASK